MKDFSRAVKEMNVPDIVQEKAQNAFTQIQEESRKHRAADDIHSEPVGLLEFRKAADDLFIFRLCFTRDRFCCFRIISVN